MHPDFSAAKIEKKSAQIMRANTVIITFVCDFFCGTRTYTSCDSSLSKVV